MDAEPARLANAAVRTELIDTLGAILTTQIGAGIQGAFVDIFFAGGALGE